MHPHSFPSLSTIALQLAAVTALVLANAFFVAAEFALVSVRKTRIDQLAGEGNHTAALVQKSLREMDRQIAAAQVGITVVSLLLGSYGEKVLEPLFLPLFAWMPKAWLGITQAGLAFALAYLVMTAMHVIIGEQLPKTIAIQKADMMAMLIVRPMMLFTRLCTPLVWILNLCVNFLVRCMGLHTVEGHAQVHSPEELDLLFTQSHEGGELNATELEILHRVVKFSDLTAREVMVPRVEMRAIPIGLSLSELRAFLQDQPHTRTPVYRDSLDDIVGIAHIKDMVRLAAQAGAASETGSTAGAVGQEPHGALAGAVREAARVPETMTIDRLLLEFKKRRQQMAIVIDEYGGTAGVVTMGDLLEQVFGDVHDEFDEPEAEILEQADGRIHLNGRVLVDVVNERYGLGFRTDEVDTMAGLILGALGRPAVVGDEVSLNGAHLRVESIDRLRITGLSLQLPPSHLETAGETLTQG